MKRTWRAWPDSVYQYRDGFGDVIEVPYVSRDALVEALVDGATFLDRSGGALIVTVGRQPTDLQGEALTTAVMVQWQSGATTRTDPEAPHRLAHEEDPLPAPLAAEEDETVHPDQETLDGLDEAVEDPDSPDGADESRFPEEDLSEVPEAMR